MTGRSHSSVLPAMNPEPDETARLVDNSSQETPGFVLSSGSAPLPQANLSISRRPPSNRVRRPPVGYLSELEQSAIQRRTQGPAARRSMRRGAGGAARGRKKGTTGTDRKCSGLVPKSKYESSESGQTMKEALDSLSRLISEPHEPLDYSQTPNLARLMSEYRQEQSYDQTVDDSSIEEPYDTMPNEKTSAAIQDLDHMDFEARSEPNPAPGTVHGPDASSIQAGTRRTRSVHFQEPHDSSLNDAVDSSLLPENQTVLQLEDIPEHIREEYPFMTELCTNPVAMAAFLAERREFLALFPDRRPNDSLAESLASIATRAPRLPDRARRTPIRKTRFPTRIPRYWTAPKKCMLPGCDCGSSFDPDAVHATQARRSPEASQWSADVPMRAAPESAFFGNHEVENAGEPETSAFSSAAVQNEEGDAESF